VRAAHAVVAVERESSGLREAAKASASASARRGVRRKRPRDDGASSSGGGGDLSADGASGTRSSALAALAALEWLPVHFAEANALGALGPSTASGSASVARRGSASAAGAAAPSRACAATWTAGTGAASSLANPDDAVDAAAAAAASGGGAAVEALVRSAAVDEGGVTDAHATEPQRRAAATPLPRVARCVEVSWATKLRGAQRHIRTTAASPLRVTTTPRRGRLGAPAARGAPSRAARDGARARDRRR
jgi:hypothetical protein